MRLTTKFSTSFKKDYKRLKRRKYDVSALDDTIDMLASRQVLPASYRDHELFGDFAGCRECHIAPDWILVYQIIENELILYLTRTGSHSDIFK